MRFDIVTIFPRMIEAALAEGIRRKGDTAARYCCASARAIFVSSPTIGIEPWTTCPTAAGRAWC